MPSRSIKVEFDSIDRETQNKVRFCEKDSDGKSGVIDKLYVRKSAWEELGKPAALTVTLEGADG